MATARKKPAAPAAPNQGVEVSGVCVYPFPDDVKPSQEVEALAAGMWAPTTQDMEAVAHTPSGNKRPALTEVRRIGDLNELIALFVLDARGKDRQPRSVRRVNIIGHGAPGLIGLSGTVNFTEPDGGVRLLTPNSADPLSGGFDRSTAKWLDEDEEGKSHRDRIRRVLTDDAEIALILCHSALLDGEFLMRTMAETFRATILGFTDAIFYHPRVNAARTALVDRRITSHGREGARGPGYKCWVATSPELSGTHLDFPIRRISQAKLGQAAGRAAWEESRRAGRGGR